MSDGCKGGWYFVVLNWGVLGGEVSLELSQVWLIHSLVVLWVVGSVVMASWIADDVITVWSGHLSHLVWKDTDSRELVLLDGFVEVLGGVVAFETEVVTEVREVLSEWTSTCASVLDVTAMFLVVALGVVVTVVWVTVSRAVIVAVIWVLSIADKHTMLSIMAVSLTADIIAISTMSIWIAIAFMRISLVTIGWWKDSVSVWVVDGLVVGEVVVTMSLKIVVSVVISLEDFLMVVAWSNSWWREVHANSLNILGAVSIIMMSNSTLMSWSFSAWINWEKWSSVSILVILEKWSELSHRGKSLVSISFMSGWSSLMSKTVISSEVVLLSRSSNK